MLEFREFLWGNIHLSHRLSRLCSGLGLPCHSISLPFDIFPVLAYAQSLPTASISLKLLSFKTLFLTIYSSISRVSSMARMALSLEETRDSAILKFVSLEKQAREGKVRGFFQIPKFTKDPKLCPIWALSIYFNKVTSTNF